jgi:hypothetical protein
MTMTRAEFNSTDDSNNGDSAEQKHELDSRVEINLYDDLLAFAALSPAERSRLSREEAVPQREGLAAGPPTKATSDNEPHERNANGEGHPTAGSEPSVDSQLTNELRDSGPFGAFDPEFRYTGALSSGICLACGAASGADDLFCITCGAFVDEAEVPIPHPPVCPECGFDASAEEIFCLECSALLTVPNRH